MFFANRHTAVLAVGSIIAVGLLSGCTITIPEPNPTTAVQKIEEGAKQAGDSIAEQLKKLVNTDLTIEQQLAQLTEGFKKLYCPVRESPLADSIVDAAKSVWNGLAADFSAKNPGVAVPTFNPDDPAMCK
ncbi:MAG TPA: hypothetical protein VGO98_02605 [Candidatus Saccharimonadales bacterium]|jgi:hypothetical protein|nr:hypothetical protein [Candidatus Saccharimonadales bacterium]